MLQNYTLYQAIRNPHDQQLYEITEQRPISSLIRDSPTNDDDDDDGEKFIFLFEIYFTSKSIIAMTSF